MEVLSYIVYISISKLIEHCLCRNNIHATRYENTKMNGLLFIISYGIYNMFVNYESPLIHLFNGTVKFYEFASVNVFRFDICQKFKPLRNNALTFGNLHVILVYSRLYNSGN